MDITVKVCQNLNWLKENYTEPLRVRLKAWKAKNVDPYTGKMYQLSKENLKNYKQNVQTVNEKQGSIDFYERMSNNVLTLVHDYERKSNQIDYYRSNFIEKKHVEEFIAKLEKYKVIDFQMNKVEQGLRSSQTNILLNEVKKLRNQLNK